MTSRREQMEVAARRERVLMMRAAGMTCQQICDQEPTLKTASNVAQDAARALAARVRERKAEGNPVALELERLAIVERAATTLMRNAATGPNASPKLVLASIDRLVKISTRRSLLLGLSHAGPSAGQGAGDEFDEVAAQRRKRRAAQGW